MDEKTGEALDRFCAADDPELLRRDAPELLVSNFASYGIDLLDGEDAERLQAAWDGGGAGALWRLRTALSLHGLAELSPRLRSGLWFVTFIATPGSFATWPTIPHSSVSGSARQASTG